MLAKKQWRDLVRKAVAKAQKVLGDTRADERGLQHILVDAMQHQPFSPSLRNPFLSLDIVAGRTTHRSTR